MRFVKPLLAAAASLMLAGAASGDEKDGRLFVHDVLKVGNSYTAEIGNFDPYKDTGPVWHFSLYDGAVIVEYNCSNSRCTRQKYRITGQNVPSSRIHMLEEETASMPGDAVKPKKLVLDCKKEKASAKGFSSEENAIRWISYMLEFRHRRGKLDGCLAVPEAKDIFTY